MPPAGSSHQKSRTHPWFLCVPHLPFPIHQEVLSVPKYIPKMTDFFWASHCYQPGSGHSHLLSRVDAPNWSPASALPPLQSFYLTATSELKRSKQITLPISPAESPPVALLAYENEMENSPMAREALWDLAATCLTILISYHPLHHVSPIGLSVPWRYLPQSYVITFSSSLARIFSPLIFPWLTSPRRGLISFLKELPKALPPGYILHSRCSHQRLFSWFICSCATNQL